MYFKLKLVLKQQSNNKILDDTILSILVDPMNKVF